MLDGKTKKALDDLERIDQQCRKIAEVCREKAKAIDDADVRADYEYLARGFSQLARRIELGTNATNKSAKSSLH